MKPGKLIVLAEMGILLAAGLALAQVKLFVLPNGGSVSLGVFPIMLLAARRGWRRGVVAGGLLGCLVVALRPMIVHPVQFLLDYPLAYGLIGCAGVVAWESPLKAISATCVANMLRFLCHVAAGMVFFTDPALPVKAALAASFTYNATHMLPETLICAAIAALLVSGHPNLVARVDVGPTDS